MCAALPSIAVFVSWGNLFLLGISSMSSRFLMVAPRALITIGVAGFDVQLSL